MLLSLISSTCPLISHETRRYLRIPQKQINYNLSGKRRSIRLWNFSLRAYVERNFPKCRILVSFFLQFFLLLSRSDRMETDPRSQAMSRSCCDSEQQGLSAVVCSVCRPKRLKCVCGVQMVRQLLRNDFLKNL